MVIVWVQWKKKKLTAWNALIKSNKNLFNLSIHFLHYKSLLECNLIAPHRLLHDDVGNIVIK